MDIGNMLNTKRGSVAATAAAADAQLRQHLEQAVQMSARPSSNINIERSSTSNHQPPLHPMAGLASEMRYPSPSQTSHGLQMVSDGFMTGKLPENGFQQTTEQSETRTNGDSAAKSFACSTCSKGFARRSDLARHERIHSGHRPHVCDHPGCGKQFIQRSALTVHARVHTGEKPHMCERCGKPFSDSSSLARHRRIHSGKRPYKCPYANCQKTFTRRTTLTRHQNHHTGTIEEAAAETNALLSNNKAPPGRRSDGGLSDTGSAHSTPSPSQRPTSLSPGHELPPIPNIPRQPSDFGFLPQNGSLPPHMRNDFPQHSPRSSPGATSISLAANFSNIPLPRPSMTSHPSRYGPPQPLEPPTSNEHRSNGSAGGSPHMTALGWGSPTHTNMPSPGPVDNYAYPDPTYGGGHPLYYPGSNIRRPQSTEPENYELRPRNMGNQLPSNVAVGAEWSSMPVSMQPMH